MPSANTCRCDQARGFNDVFGRHMIERADLVVLAPASPVLELFGCFGDRLLADFDIHTLAPDDFVIANAPLARPQ
jgi:hypothetical protein